MDLRRSITPMTPVTGQQSDIRQHSADTRPIRPSQFNPNLRHAPLRGRRTMAGLGSSAVIREVIRGHQRSPERSSGRSSESHRKGGTRRHQRATLYNRNRVDSLTQSWLRARSYRLARTTIVWDHIGRILVTINIHQLKCLTDRPSRRSSRQGTSGNFLHCHFNAIF